MTDLILPEGKDLFDNIEAYYLSDKKLSPKELEIAERLEVTFGLLQHHRNKKIVVSKMIALCKRQDKTLSVAQAYKDIVNAERIFVPIQQYSKEFLRLTIIESCLRDIKKLEDKMRRDQLSETAWAKLMDQKNKCEYRLIQASGLMDGSIDLPDFSKINPDPININVSEKFLEIMQQIANKGKVNVSEFMASNADDAEIIK